MVGFSPAVPKPASFKRLVKHVEIGPVHAVVDPSVMSLVIVLLDAKRTQIVPAMGRREFATSVEAVLQQKYLLIKPKP